MKKILTKIKRNRKRVLELILVLILLSVLIVQKHRTKSFKDSAINVSINEKNLNNQNGLIEYVY